jgi:hypothetical protein
MSLSPTELTLVAVLAAGLITVMLTLLASAVLYIRYGLASAKALPSRPRNRS